MRKYLNNWSSAITTVSIGTGDLTFDVATAPTALAAGDYYIATLTDSLTAPTKIEIIKITGVSGSTLTVERAQESTTAQTWDNTEFIHISATADGFETLDGPELLRYRERTGTASSGAITTADGLIQSIALTANTTLSFPDLQDGQNVTLHVTGLDSGWTLSFPVGAKTPTFPDLSAAAEAVFQIWQKSAQIYVSYPQVYS